MPDENRVFDISKPGSTNPHPAGRPVILGHQPSSPDPMVKEEHEAPKPTHILVQDAHHDEPAEKTTDKPDESTTGLFGVHPDDSQSNSFGINHESFTGGSVSQPPLMPETDTSDSDNHQNVVVPQSDTVPSHDEFQAKSESNDNPSVEPHLPIDHLGGVEGIHLPPQPHSKKGLKIVLVILLLLIAGYLFIDSNVVNTGIKLPFHIFKQKVAVVSVTTTPPPAAPPAAQTPAVPVGFTQYKITGTNVSFASPTTWGKPTSTIDKGYAARSAGAAADSNYAYVVDFPNNKDVQLAATTSKYLPPAREILYYDFLQWCTGSNDGKYYFSVLKFTTTNKVDTPSTITCDQLPSVVPTKLDNTTLAQTAVKDTAGKVIGDIYTKNLTNKDLPVLHIKDATSQNADNIKKLLATVNDQ